MLVLSLGLLSLAACTTTIEYTPNPKLFRGTLAISKIGALLRGEAKDKIRATVTNSYFKVTWIEKRSSMFNPLWHKEPHPTARTVHFKVVTSHRLRKKKGRYRAELFDASGRRLYLYVTEKEREAKAFLDAVFALRQRAMAKG